MLHRALAPRRLVARLATPFVLALIGLLLYPAVGLAHANLDRSDPADGAALATAPPVARLWFSEDVEPGFTRAVVVSEAGAPASTGSQVAPDDPRLLVVDLAPNLGPGWYTISWQALARIDGHLTVGALTFGVGVSGPSPALAAAETVARTGSDSPVAVALRWLILLSAMAVVGAFAFWTAQGRSARPASRRDRILPGQWALAELAWILFVLANVVFLVNAVATATPAATLDDLGPPLARFATQTAFGQLWLARMALGSGLGVALLYRGTSARSGWDRPALLLGAALLLSFSLASHSATVSTLAPLAIVNDWLHFAAATVWVGGLLQLAVALSSAPGRGAAASLRPAPPDLVRRFATMAGGAVAVLAATGVVEAAFHVGAPANIVETGYGRVVLLKTLLLIALAALAAKHRTLLPTLSARELSRREPNGSGPPTSGKLDPALARLVRVEALGAIVLVAAVGLLTSLSPP